MRGIRRVVSKNLQPLWLALLIGAQIPRTFGFRSNLSSRQVHGPPISATCTLAPRLSEKRPSLSSFGCPFDRTLQLASSSDHAASESDSPKSDDDTDGSPSSEDIVSDEIASTTSSEKLRDTFRVLRTA
jgi:hypothetical protein